MHSSLVLFLCIFVAVVSAVKRIEDVKIEILDHFPCKNELNTWKEKIKFPSSPEALLEPHPEFARCYRLGGDVKVTEPLHTDRLQLHLHVSHSTKHVQQDGDCYEYDANTMCGGVGSCLYCGLCDSVFKSSSKQKRKQGAALWLSRGLTSVNCKQAARAAVRNQRITKLNSTFDVDKNGVFVHFCLPSKEQLLEMQGITKEVWKQLTLGDSAEPSTLSVSVYLTIRVFEQDMTSYLRTQRTLENFYKTSRKQDDIPARIKREFPFNKVLVQNVGVIGCHKLIGNAYLT